MFYSSYKDGGQCSEELKLRITSKMYGFLLESLRIAPLSLITECWPGEMEIILEKAGLLPRTNCVFTCIKLSTLLAF